MKRIALSDYDGELDGTWFDSDKAVKFDEDTYWDGSNHISVATGSQWVHEALYRTAGGKYVLNHWTNYQGSNETYMIFSKGDAARWLVKNGHETTELADDIAQLEVA